MSVFNPEMKEFSESGIEVNKFSPDMEKKLLKALDDGKEKYPDIIQCPNKFCGTPLMIEMQKDSIRVYCTNCGWENILHKLQQVDQKRLRMVTENFRSAIEPCWSEGSAYKIPGIAQYGPFISGGQCAVTCLVLKDVLAKEFPGIPTFLASGQLQSTDGQVVITDHGWLKVGLGDQIVIIDPTADQAPQIQEKVIIGTTVELEVRGLRYIEKEVEDGHGEIEHPNRFKRYTILKNAYMPR
jgi:hypothetical protein